jgi:hypothetical protein
MSSSSGQQQQQQNASGFGSYFGSSFADSVSKLGQIAEEVSSQIDSSVQNVALNIGQAIRDGRDSPNSYQDLSSGFHCLCPQLTYLVLCRIFLIASTIGKLIGIYQEYPAKSVGKQGK